MSSASKASRLIPKWKHIPIHPVLEGPSGMAFSACRMSRSKTPPASPDPGLDSSGSVSCSAALVIAASSRSVVPAGRGRAIAEMQVSPIDIGTA